MFRTKTGPKLSIPAVKNGRKSLSLSGCQRWRWRVSIIFKCFLWQVTQALVIFLTIRLPQSSQNFCLYLFNVYFAEMCSLLSWIFWIFSFESGCLSLNKIGDLLSCEMSTNFKRPSQRKIPSFSSFTFKSRNLKLLSLNQLNEIQIGWLSVKVFRLPLTRSAWKLTR